MGASFDADEVSYQDAVPFFEPSRCS